MPSHDHGEGGRNEQVNFGQVHQESYSRPFGGELIIDELDP